MRELYIGVMSGTSMDGVDCALVEFTHHYPKLLEFYAHPMPFALKDRLQAICLGQPTSLAEVGELDHLLGHLYANAINAFLAKQNLAPSDIRAIGNHGQTVFHSPEQPNPFTMQIGDANIIAARTGIDTIADFRRKDVALGGQGAPLVPAFHNTIFAPQDSSVVVLNIGGIANISVLSLDSPVIGYDTGPGNTLMDIWVAEQFDQKYDSNGKLASQGNIIPKMLDAMLNDSYFAKAYPKSTGRELFNQQWLAQFIRPEYSAVDVLRTLNELTIITITDQVTRYKQGSKPELLVCGGGVHNAMLMKGLQDKLPDWHVAPTSEKGINTDYMEALAFAWLAERFVHNMPSNLPEVTGASRSVPLGVLYPKVV